jgi:hypothetical protein
MEKHIGKMPTLVGLFSSDGRLAFGFLGGLVSQPSAAGHFHTAFFVDSEALGGDDVAFFADGFAFSPENESG